MLDTQLEELRMKIGLFMPRGDKDKAAVAGKWGRESKKLTVSNATAGSKKRSNNLGTKKPRSR